MGIIVNTAKSIEHASSKSAIQNLNNGLNEICYNKSISKNIQFNLDESTKACPIINECKDIRKGIVQGDYVKAVSNGLLVGLYVLPVGNASLKVGTKSSYAKIIQFGGCYTTANQTIKATNNTNG